MSSLRIIASASASRAAAQYENITGTVERTCIATPCASHSATRRPASQQFDSISRKTLPSRTIRAQHGAWWMTSVQPP